MHTEYDPFQGMMACCSLQAEIAGLNVKVLEAHGRSGGKLQSISQDGLTWDEGAITMTASEEEVGFLPDNLALTKKQELVRMLFTFLMFYPFLCTIGWPYSTSCGVIQILLGNWSFVEVILERSKLHWIWSFVGKGLWISHKMVLGLLEMELGIPAA
ncbi:protoporphyrinogen oxidase, mitochondrial [Olea europaea subsp. europaea]|uniref:Protoporphyrinogen oxidase, mitochondrial n=1 Tax=Olea europaea subsp. europaea TaxID=158383 RepID=A0A8S0TIG9_OLEEU|nr:protoporphyrinogen oxidase, mitochondrial [Olea europaea subsp. europaea]